MGKNAKIIIGIIIAALLGLLIYVNLIDWYKKGVDQARTVERKVWQEKAEGLESQIADLEKQLTETAEPPESEEKVTEALGQSPSGRMQNEKPLDLEDVNAQVMAFFAYLDSQPYISEFNLNEGSYQQYLQVIDLISQNPPLIVGETDSLHRLYKNMAHFFRVLGKTRIKLIKDVLTNEYHIMESVMRTFYLYYTLQNKSGKKVSGRPDLRISYTYASYFLETISGRSYLLRRNSKIRLLSYYYSIMFLDHANEDQLNFLGLDIRPHIKAASQDIRNQMGLANRKIYLRDLEKLAQKYKMQ
jgi:hypothetical protein